MAKDPAFLFYPGDWLGGTLGMTFEEKGAYMELLMMQFTRGHMTERMIHQTVGQLWVNLKDKFEKDAEGLWFNGRLDIEKEKRKSYVDSRKNNKNGSNQHTHKPKKQKAHMTSHMEDVNENRNEIKDFERGVGKTFELPEETEREKEITDTAKYLISCFGWNEIRDFSKMSEARTFLIYLDGSGGMEWFVEQFNNYFDYKKISKENSHNLTSFIGTPAKEYQNGGWNAAVWSEKLKQYQHAKSQSTNSEDRKKSVANAAKSADDYINRRMSENG